MHKTVHRLLQPAHLVARIAAIVEKLNVKLLHHGGLWGGHVHVKLTQPPVRERYDPERHPYACLCRGGRCDDS